MREILSAFTSSVPPWLLATVLLASSVEAKEAPTLQTLLSVAKSVDEPLWLAGIAMDSAVSTTDATKLMDLMNRSVWPVSKSFQGFCGPSGRVAYIITRPMLTPGQPKDASQVTGYGNIDGCAIAFEGPLRVQLVDGDVHKTFEFSNNAYGVRGVCLLRDDVMDCVAQPEITAEEFSKIPRELRLGTPK